MLKLFLFFSASYFTPLQIVKAYYGGREVTPEDLEMALFVGMSPHERRRFEKKKGLSFLNPEKRTISKGSTCTAVEAAKKDSEMDHSTNQELITGKFDVSDGGQGDLSTTNEDVDRRQPPEKGNNCTLDYGNGDGITSESDKKLSLLGHGPHGKQVVEHLLNNYGEEGIREFCQRWRQVFVEAIHPRFLPSGWNIKHR